MINKILFLLSLVAFFHLAFGNGPTREVGQKKIQKMELSSPSQNDKVREDEQREKKKKYEEKKLKWLMEHEARYPHDL